MHGVGRVEREDEWFLGTRRQVDLDWQRFVAGGRRCHCQAFVGARTTARRRAYKAATTTTMIEVKLMWLEMVRWGAIVPCSLLLCCLGDNAFGECTRGDRARSLAAYTVTFNVTSISHVKILVSLLTARSFERKFFFRFNFLPVTGCNKNTHTHKTPECKRQHTVYKCHQFTLRRLVSNEVDSEASV